MTLFEFIEHFNKDTEIVVLYYGNIEYKGPVSEITDKNLRNREVLQGAAAMLDGAMCIPVKRIYPNGNVDVIIKLREELSETDKSFIEQEIEKMMHKHGIERDGDLYYKKQDKPYEDFDSIISFYFDVSCKTEWKKYIKGLGYVSNRQKAHSYIEW